MLALVAARSFLVTKSAGFDFMKKKSILIVALIVCTACSPRDFLTRRLATDLILAAPAFTTPQQLLVQTGIVSSKEYPSSELLVLQHHGWINVSTATCPAGIAPPPCWDLTVTPSGVDAVRTLISAEDAAKPSFSIPVAKRELVGITGITKEGNAADVEFLWHWTPLNEIGAALYSSDVRYVSSTAFQKYDDGWRVLTGNAHPQQTLEDALKNAEPAH
jgi:hypothetical protein